MTQAQTGGRAPRQAWFTLGTRTVHKPRLPGRYFRDAAGPAAVFPLVVLFGLNAVDELDRTAFGIILPEIRDHFDLDLSAALAIVAASSNLPSVAAL